MRRWECPWCQGHGWLAPGQQCYLCAGTGLKDAVRIGFQLDYGRSANLEFINWGRTFPCRGARCACPAHCLVHPRD